MTTKTPDPACERTMPAELRDWAEKTDVKTAEMLRRAADEIVHWGVLHDTRLSQLREAGRELDELRSALSDAADAFEECTGDYAQELASDDLVRWRRLVGVEDTCYGPDGSNKCTLPRFHEGDCTTEATPDA